MTAALLLLLALQQPAPCTRVPPFGHFIAVIDVTGDASGKPVCAEALKIAHPELSRDIDFNLAWQRQWAAKRTVRLYLTLPQVTPPKASFVASCPPATLKCSFDASASQKGSGGPIVRYRWTWGDTATGTRTLRGESHVGPATSNTWPRAGRYTVKLTVVDSAGRVSNVTQKTLTLPLAAKPTTPPVACVPVVRVVHDTIAMKITLPQNLPQMRGYIHADSGAAKFGHAFAIFRTDFIGTYIPQANGTVMILQARGPVVQSGSPQVAIGYSWFYGNFPSLSSGMQALGQGTP